MVTKKTKQKTMEKRIYILKETIKKNNSDKFDNKYYNGEYLFYNRSRRKWMENLIYFNIKCK